MKYLYYFDINGNVVPEARAMSKIKSFVGKMVKQNLIQHKILNNFYFLSFFCKKTKSYPNKHW